MDTERMNNGLYTIDDIYALPEGEKAELIKGELYMMASPSRMHQDISQFMSLELGMYIRNKGGGCKVYSDSTALYLFADDSTYLEPDVMVVCDKDKLTDKGVSGAPDFIIEIASPSSIQMDYVRKAALYLEAGVKLYWIINPDSKVSEVLVHNFEAKTMNRYSINDSIPVEIYDDLVIDLSNMDLS